MIGRALRKRYKQKGKREEGRGAGEGLVLEEIARCPVSIYSGSASIFIMSTGQN